MRCCARSRARPTGSSTWWSRTTARVPATAALIAGWQPRLGVPLAHAWHEHRGFRAGEIRNRAILASGGDYCIFLDGDCILRPDFVATHRRFAEPGWFVTGNRVLLSRALTEEILRERLEPETWGLATLVAQRRRGGVNRLLPALRLPLGPLRKLRTGAWEGARSCNLAVWRADLDRIDGFDADFSGWGLEDSDLIVRLLPRRRAPQGRRVRDRRAAPLAPRKRPLAAPRQSPPARRRDCQRPHPRRARALEPRRRGAGAREGRAAAVEGVT